MVQQKIDQSLGESSSFGPDPYGAAQRGSRQRRDLSLEVLRRTEPILQLAARRAVSRKFVSQQMAKATAAVAQAFQPAPTPENQVLFRLPVTQEGLEQDVLAVAGPPLAEREELYDFILTEWQRDQDGPQRFKPLLRRLRNQRPVLRAFVEVLQEKLAHGARRPAYLGPTVQTLGEIEALDPQSELYGQRPAHGQTLLKDQGYPIHQAVLDAMAQTPRASSLVENPNRRVRGSFFLRREIGHGYRDLRRFPRSDRPERVGRSPAELGTAQTHPHGLELLGYTRFRRN